MTDVEAWTLPIRTHLIGPRDDIVDVVKHYTKGIAEPGDVIAVAETALAIAQGRAVRSDRVHPRLLARFLRHFPHKDGSLGTPGAMEMAIRDAGAGRVLLGAAAGGIGRLLKQRGWFFRVVGPRIAQIDDIAGTLPPYDNYIVLGPERPEEAAEAIREATGVDAAVADVNDLKRADILAHTGPHPPEQLSAWLRHNPFGNGDQQTPIVIIKPNSGSGGGNRVS